MKKWLRKIPLVVAVLVVGGLLVYGFWPVPTEVDAVQVTRGSFQVTVNDDGKTRIREKYIVSAPVGGKMLRIELEEGDAVRAGETMLAQIEPSDPTLLDARTQAEAEARVRASEASVNQAEMALERAKHAHELAEHKYGRARKLAQDGIISAEEFDGAEHGERMAQADLRSAEFSLAVTSFELDLAKAALIRTLPDPNGDVPATLPITSPIEGKVLRVFQESAGVVAPGAPLLEIGDPHDLEMEIDVLSTDAVQVRPGAKVLIEHWGGADELEGSVRRVEPSAFLKVSALGVEEQRVNIIADFTSPFEERPTLGDGYRIEARIVVGDALDVIKVPAGALFRQGNTWHVFRISGDRAELVPVETGKSNGLETEIISGLTEGDWVILHPSDEIASGDVVRTR